MARKKSTAANPAQPELYDVKVRTAPCVPAIREKVKAWAAFGYKGATDTSRRLLNHWFKTDHRIGGRKFRYELCQRESIETLIYLYEVVKVRRQKSLIETFSTRSDLKLLQHDDFARYCIKMATGSGKTKVMSLAIAWQYFNAVAEASEDYAKTFLVIAPNVIVFERLRSDFEGGRIFQHDPLIPEELRIFWDFQCYMRGEGERAGSNGALYLTNVQQLYEKDETTGDEPDEMTAVLGPKPPAKTQTVEDFAPRIAKRGGPVVVLNDEAHHTHDEDSAWNECIRSLHDKAPLAAQLDFTATPRHTQGQLFSWTVFDYPLKQAIIDGIVKRPVKGITKGIHEKPSTIASVKYQAYLTAGVERWREYRDGLAELKRKPILFVMLNSTAEADDVGDWLRKKYPEEFAGEKLLIIHTDKSGEVSKKDLDKARQVARDVDRGTSPVNCIVSVLMLREGWDVQGVTVIVGLRPYAAKANILPEQTVGRGLRLMFRDMAHQYQERVDVIGSKGFMAFVEQLEKEEDYQLDEFEVGKDKVVIVTIVPDESKLDMDIALPELTPVLVRKKSLEQEIAELDVPAPPKPIPFKETDKEAEDFTYEGYDLIEMKKLFERDYKIPAPQTAEEVIGYYARRIAQDLKLPSQFAALVPKVREFLEEKAFGKKVRLDTPDMMMAISSNYAGFVTIQTFVKALRDKIVDVREPELVNAGRLLSTTPGFPWSRPTVKSEKCVFNLVPCRNKYEQRFAKFLHDAGDVVRFAILPDKFGFVIEYTDANGNLRHYEPDFVIVTADGVHHIVETKGMEDIHVKHKDQAAALWCENATTLTGKPWAYRIVHEKDFDKLQPDLFADLEALGGKGGLFD
jgi:type III restriction enzyme